MASGVATTPERTGHRSAAPVFEYGIILAVLAALYYSTFVWLVEAWMVPDSNYSHGFWVPLVIAYFLWEKRASLAAVPKEGSRRGLRWIALALGMHLAGLILDVHFLSGVSLLPMVWGLALWYFGPHVLSLIFWPSMFLLFMIPLPFVSTWLTIRLQLISAIAATGILQPFFYDVSRVGTMVALPSFTLFVEAPCSGLNTLFSLIFVGSVVAYLARGVWWRKLILLLTAPLIAVVANIFRIILIALLGEFYGEEVAMGVFHKGSGVIMYSIGLALFLLEAWLLRIRLAPGEERA